MGKLNLKQDKCMGSTSNEKYPKHYDAITAVFCTCGNSYNKVKTKKLINDSNHFTAISLIFLFICS